METEIEKGKIMKNEHPAVERMRDNAPEIFGALLELEAALVDPKVADGRRPGRRMALNRARRVVMLVAGSRRPA